jgi:serine protease Do
MSCPPSLPPRKTGRLRAVLLLGTALVVLPAAGFALATQGATAETVAPAAAVTDAPASFAGIVRSVAPAVVNVSTVVEADRVAGADGLEMPQFPPGSPFEDFFEKFFRDQPGRGPGTMPGDRQTVRGQGSGFVVDPDGYIVTNNHVVANAKEIMVTLEDGTELPATLIGRDEKTDLALIKVDADRALASVPWGDSDAAQVGDWVVAVGNPFGLGGTVTTGIISARGRNIQAGPFDDFLQIDASINRGNSGGPTFNLAGEVIGINTAIFSPSGGSVGIGFAIPSNLARDIVADLRENGAVERGWIGVQIQTVTPELAEALGLDKPQGALVADVVADAPAAEAGLKAGDVILSFDDKPVDSMQALPRLVAATEAGRSVDVAILRNGDRETLSLDVAAMPKSEELASAEQVPGPQVEESLGLSLARLTPETRREYGVDDAVSGVLVTGIREDSPARDTDMAPGDIIVQVGHDPVSTPADVMKGVETARGHDRGAVMLLVNRGGSERFVAMKLKQA